MTQEQKRIAIAEACGILNCITVIEAWKRDKPTRLDGYCEGQRVAIPDYLNDLNAMHEAEKSLSDSQKISYYHNLAMWRDDTGEPTENLYEVAHATAAQRADAFLETISE